MLGAIELKVKIVDEPINSSVTILEGEIDTVPATKDGVPNVSSNVIPVGDKVVKVVAVCKPIDS